MKKKFSQVLAPLIVDLKWILKRLYSVKAGFFGRKTVQYILWDLLALFSQTSHRKFQEKPESQTDNPDHFIKCSCQSYHQKEFSISRMTSSPSLLIWLSFYSNLVMFLMHWSYNAIWPQALKEYLHYLSLIWWLHYFCWVPMLREREPARCIRPTPGIRTRTLKSTKWHHRVVKQCGFGHPNNFHPSVGGILNKESKNSW